jgi:hypothetical protein
MEQGDPFTTDIELVKIKGSTIRRLFRLWDFSKPYHQQVAKDIETIQGILSKCQAKYENTDTAPFQIEVQMYGFLRSALHCFGFAAPSTSIVGSAYVVIGTRRSNSGCRWLHLHEISKTQT